MGTKCVQNVQIFTNNSQNDGKYTNNPQKPPGCGIKCTRNMQKITNISMKSCGYTNKSWNTTKVVKIPKCAPKSSGEFKYFPQNYRSETKVQEYFRSAVGPRLSLLEIYRLPIKHLAPRDYSARRLDQNKYSQISLTCTRSCRFEESTRLRSRVMLWLGPECYSGPKVVIQFTKHNPS